MTIVNIEIDAVIAAVFAKPEPLIVEAYSQPGEEPLIFRSPEALSKYIAVKFSEPRGYAFFFVVYPDMQGVPIQTTIQLRAPDGSNTQVRYTWGGWGLISVQLYGAAHWGKSCISANSAKRAAAWALSYPEWSAPEDWNWKAVESHVRRLRRTLKKKVL